jgi:terminase small subunit-like protein
VRELGRGPTMKDICVEPGMPCGTTVRQRAVDDIKGFAARYSRAREIGEKIVAEVTSGRTLADLCSEPGMPRSGLLALGARL